MQPEGCWALTIYDYLAPIGKTPDEAVDALAAKVAAEEPTDRNDQARQAAIVSLAEQLVVASTSPGRIAYEARDKAGLVGTFEVQSWSTEGWVVARTVVPMPASFCQSEDSSAND